MTADIIRQIAFQLLVSGAQERDSRRHFAIAEAYWDLMYLYRFGVLIPEVRLPVNPGGPDPSPISIARDNSLLLFELVNFVVEDPEPQPNLKTFLGREARLAAVKAVHERLARAVKLADMEISRLTQQG